MSMLQNTSTLTQASHQWATRPDDERFVSLYDMRDHFDARRNQSSQNVVSTRHLEAHPDTDNKGLFIVGESKNPATPTHWAFGQLAALAGAPASYLRELPSPIAADCINYGMRFKRDIDEVKLLLRRDDGNVVVDAANGPNYGRIWNGEIIDNLIHYVGDGVSGDWKVPGEFGKDVPITKANTTLFAGDRDMFVFLADEKHRIELPGRRAGMMGTFARGFFMWNSEVGSKTYGIATFLFDYTCCNRIVWGVEGFNEIRIRHTKSAPDKYLEEMRPAIEAYANGTASGVIAAIEDARSNRLADVDEFLAGRFGKRLVEPLKIIHKAEELRPIETRWDAVTAATAYARSIRNQDDRVEFERTAGALLQAA